MRLRFRHFLPRTFLWRTICLTILPLLIADILLAQFFLDRHWNAIGEQLATNLVSEVSLLLKDFDEVESSEYHKVFNKYRDTFDFHIGYVEEAPDYNSFKKQKKFQTAYLRDAVKKKIPYPTLVSLQNKKQLEIYIWHPKGLITVDTILSRVYASTTHLFFAWMIGTLLGIILIVIPFIRGQVRSIKKLSVAANKFGKGEDFYYSPSGSAEIRQAGQAFLIMKARISRFIEGRTQMLSAVSHDIRTPLTRMRLSLESVKDKKVKQDLLDDIKDIEIMVNSYLDFVRDEIKEDPKKIDLKIFLEDINKDVICNGKRIESVNLKKGIKCKLFVRENEFKRALINVLNNACRYAKSKTLVSYINNGKYIEIYIEDDGPGIPKDRRDEMFKPFARMDKSRNKDNGGVGLGLTIAKNVIQHHGGKITLLGSEKLGGLKVKIVLPV